MYMIEKVTRKIKNEDKEVKAFFGKGRMTSDVPEIREAKGYKVISNFGFSLACDAGKNQDGSRKTNFFSLVFWDKNAEYISTIAQKVRKAQAEAGLEDKGLKGRNILIFGRIEKGTSKNKNGETKEYDVLVVERFDFDDYPNRGTNDGATSEEVPANTATTGEATTGGATGETTTGATEGVAQDNKVNNETNQTPASDPTDGLEGIEEEDYDDIPF